MKYSITQKDIDEASVEFGLDKERYQCTIIFMIRLSRRLKETENKVRELVERLDLIDKSKEDVEWKYRSYGSNE